ncbi:MAG: tripartite tricarboxylate transporter substrate binding protein [Burkholderiaceae bacterium]
MTTAIAAAVLSHSTSQAQNFPSRSIRLVVPYGAGSGTDATARAIGARLFESSGQSVVVENAPAANGIPATAAFAAKPGDGYSLLMVAANHVINPHLFSNVPFDPVKDFRGVARIGHLAFVLCVHPSVQANTLPELIAYAKTRPGQLSYSSPGNGSPPHLATELLKSMAGLHVVHIPYRGAGQAIADLIAGQVQLSFVVESAAIPQIRAGKLKPLAISSARRSPNLPDVPTADERGQTGFDLVSWIGILAPAATAPELVRNLGAEVLSVLQRPDLSDQLRKIGFTLNPVAGPEFDIFIASEGAKWGKIVKDSRAKID